ncbi:MAG TPA: tetratricopeptide repeat protein [Myxococcales bacterium]|nr:tetratricopeptide repeat protein [Myxococcales bacterium]
MREHWTALVFAGINALSSGCAGGMASDTAPGAGGTFVASSNPQAQESFEKGKALLKARQYDEAQPAFARCLELDPNAAECHLAMGSTLARTRKPQEGAEHYREFLRLAPDHPRAKEVKQLLKEYDEARAKQPAPSAPPASSSSP